MTIFPKQPGWFATLTLAAFLTLAGCSDDQPVGPDGVTLDDLAGTWTAIEFEFSQHEAGPALPSVDLVAQGATITLQIEASGDFTLRNQHPVDGTESDTGMLGFDPEAEDFLWIIFDEDPNDEVEFFFVAVNDNSFRLVDNTGEGEFDLDGDGTEERARINSTWEH